MLLGCDLVLADQTGHPIPGTARSLYPELFPHRSSGFFCLFNIQLGLSLQDAYRTKAGSLRKVALYEGIKLMLAA